MLLDFFYPKKKWEIVETEFGFYDLYFDGNISCRGFKSAYEAMTKIPKDKNNKITRL